MYSAESIIAALKSNAELLCENIDAVSCPSSHSGCTNDPDPCEKCLNRRCKQPVTIHRDYKKLSVLNFYFMLSSQNHGGFIHKDDLALKKLITHKFIDKTKLRLVMEDLTTA